MSTAQLRVAQLESQLVESELRIEQLEEVLREQGKSETSRLENIDQVIAEVTRLRGSIEVLTFQASELQRSVGDQQLAQERRQLHDEMRLAQVEKFLGVKPPPPPTDEDLGLTATEGGEEVDGVPTADGGDEVEGDGTDEGDPEDLVPEMPEGAAGKLELAAEHMAGGRQRVARAILKAAIDEHVGAEEMPEIRYRYAETYFNEEDYRGAIGEFNRVINNHPNSPWKCWSFFRQGEAFEAMGNAEGARAFYQGATERDCKSSDAAKEAKKKL